jgi:hypothetical protein
VLPERGRYQCRHCQAQQAACPHDWVWLVQQRRWWCRLCDAEQPDARAVKQRPCAWSAGEPCGEEAVAADEREP